MGKADTEEVGLYLGGAKYFIAPSIAHCDWVVYAVNAGDKPMGHWLLVVPAWWSLAKKTKKKHFCRPLQCVGPPGKCPVCPITSPALLTTFYRGTIESVLTSCITVWYGNCSAADRKTLQRTVNTAAKIIGALSPPSWTFSLHDAPVKLPVSWSRARKIPSPTSWGYCVFQSGYQYVSLPCPMGYLKYRALTGP